VLATEGKSALTEWVQRQGEADSYRGPRGSESFDQDRTGGGGGPRGSEPFDQDRMREIRPGKPMAAGGAAPLHGGEVAGVEAGAGYGGSWVAGYGQRGRGCHSELDGGERAMNPWAERGERR
jgi:hypothetical protein